MRGVPRLSIFGVRLAVILLAIYWILLFTGTHLPKVPSAGIPHIDKVQHAVAFAGLAFLLAWAVPASGKNVRTKMIIAFLVAACYGMIDEWTQGWVQRTTDLHDYYADCGGALLGILAYYCLRRWIFSPSSFRRRSSRGGESASARDGGAAKARNAA